MTRLSCRAGCGACCIEPSISSPIPGMPQGKPAGVRCLQLTRDNLCLLFRDDARPRVCGSYEPNSQFCGTSNDEAFKILNELESATCAG